MKVDILGVHIDAVTRAEARLKLAEFLVGGKACRVFTPNPEMLVLAARDPDFMRVLNTADLAIPDGVGLLWAARRSGKSLPERVSGSDLMLDLIVLAAERGSKVFLLGGQSGVAREAAAKLQSEHPRLKIVGCESGGAVGREKDSGRLLLDDRVLAGIKSARPDILFVAFGHGKQEAWIDQNLAELPTVRVAMGIGGSFDFIAGRSRRAPKFMRRAGLEWFWRLVTEPWRWRRIWTAVVSFPYLVIKSGR